MGAFQAMPGVIVTTSSAMKCCDGNCVRRWSLTSFAIRTHLYLYDKGKGVCVRDVCAIYDNNISPSLLMIIIKIIILYFIQIRHTDAFPPTGTLLVNIIKVTSSTFSASVPTFMCGRCFLRDPPVNSVLRFLPGLTTLSPTCRSSGVSRFGLKGGFQVTYLRGW